MSVQFEWQAGSDDGQWETIARAGRGPGRRWLRRVPWWAWVIAAVVLTGIGTLAYVRVRRAYQEAQRQIEFQIQSVIDLEARAYAKGDVTLFLEQQDRESAGWFALQSRRVRGRCSASDGSEGVATNPCIPVLPATVQSVDLQGDVAWVEVVEELRPGQADEVLRVRFYRQTDLGWKHTAPRGAFWKTAIRIQYDDLFVLYHERDQGYVESLEEHIAVTAATVCGTTFCPSTNTLTVDFSVEVPVYEAPRLVIDPSLEGNDEILLSSPWLSGIPVSGDWDQDYLDEVSHAVAYVTAARAIRSTTKRDLSPLQDAVVDEYAAWYTGKDPAQLPLLGPIIKQRGNGVVPTLLRSAKEARTLETYLQRWYSRSLPQGDADPGRAKTYFEALLNLERQALLAGRPRTFLMLQDPDWRGIQARYYARAQRGAFSLPRVPVRAESAQVSGDYARVDLAEALPDLQGEPPQSFNNRVYFRWVDGGWRHANVLTAFFWTLMPAPTPTVTAPASPLHTPTPRPSGGS